MVVHSVVLLEPMRPVVMLLAMGGITSLVAAFYITRYTLLRNMPHFRMAGTQIQDMDLNILYGILMIGSLIFRFNPTIQSLPSVGQFLGPAGYLAFGGFYLQWCAGRLPRHLGLIVLLVGGPLELWWRVENLFITDLLLLVLFFVFIP